MGAGKMLQLPNEDVLMCAGDALFVLSAGDDFITVKSLAYRWRISQGHRDGDVRAATFASPQAMCLLDTGTILIADRYNKRLRALTADLKRVETAFEVEPK